MNKKLHIVILAAGRGSRMNSDLPKVMHKIANREIIMHIIDNVKTLKPHKITAVIADHMNQLKELLDKNNVDYIIQQEQLGTANAFECGFKNCTDSDYTLALNGDTPFISANTINNFVSDAINKKSDLNILSFKIEDPFGYGRLIVDNNKLLNIIEERDADNKIQKINLCNSGIILFKSSCASTILQNISNDNAANEYYLTDSVKIANQNSYNVSYYNIDDYKEVIGINTKHQLSEAEEIFQYKMRNKFLDDGVTIIDPKSTMFSYNTTIGNDVIIQPFNYFGNDVSIGDNVEVKSFCHLEGVEIGDNCKIGPYARIRPGSVIGSNNKIGNFVEVKNSQTDKKVNIGHLSYIGDCKIGNNSNIGAGTITCNYDGYNKHKTNIGSNCLIGSNASLVAPINIDNNVITGAGGVFLEDIQANTIAYSKVEQKILANKSDEYHKRKGNK